MHIVYFYIRLYSFYGPCGPEIKLYYYYYYYVRSANVLSQVQYNLHGLTE